MNPDATLTYFMSAMDAGRCDDAIRYATALIDWIERGGFPPASFPPGRDEALVEAYGIRYTAIRVRTMAARHR